MAQSGHVLLQSFSRYGFNASSSIEIQVLLCRLITDTGSIISQVDFIILSAF